MREMRNLITVFRGMEQIIKLNEEVKSELTEIRKVNATVQRHADRVETIFSEMQKKFSDFERMKGMTEELDKTIKHMSSDFDSMGIKIAELASKKEVENLITKFDNFEKHASNVVTVINSKTDSFKREFYGEFQKKFEKSEALLKGFEALAQKIPDLNKYFNLLEEEAKKTPKSDVKVEKIKEPGESNKEESAKPVEKEGFFSKLKGAVIKK